MILAILAAIVGIVKTSIHSHVFLPPPLAMRGHRTQLTHIRGSRVCPHVLITAFGLGQNLHHALCQLLYCSG